MFLHRYSAKVRGTYWYNDWQAFLFDIKVYYELAMYHLNLKCINCGDWTWNDGCNKSDKVE